MNTFDPAVDDVEVLKLAIHDHIDTGNCRDNIIDEVTDTENFRPPFQKEAVTLMIDKMLASGEIADDPDDPGFYVSSIYSPNTSHEWKQMKKWQHIEVGDIVMLKDSSRIVTVGDVDYYNDLFWFDEGEDYKDHPLDNVIPETPSHKQMRRDKEERERQEQIRKDNVIAEWRDKRYNEIKTLADSICRKLGHAMTPWANDCSRCNKCFRYVRIHMGDWGMDKSKTGLKGGAVEMECK